MVFSVPIYDPSSFSIRSPRNAVKEADKQKAEQKKKDRDCKATLSYQQFSNFNEFQVDFS